MSTRRSLAKRLAQLETFLAEANPKRCNCVFGDVYDNGHDGVKRDITNSPECPIHIVRVFTDFVIYPPLEDDPPISEYENDWEEDIEEVNEYSEEGKRKLERWKQYEKERESEEREATRKFEEDEADWAAFSEAYDRLIERANERDPGSVEEIRRLWKEFQDEWRPK